MRRKRFVFLNALPIQVFKKYMPVRLFIVPTTVQQLREIIKSWQEDDKVQLEILSYIRHPSTVEALSKALGVELQPSSEFYQYTEGDSVVVVVPKKLIRRGQEQQVTIEDLDIYLVNIDAEG